MLRQGEHDVWVETTLAFGTLDDWYNVETGHSDRIERTNYRKNCL